MQKNRKVFQIKKTTFGPIIKNPKKTIKTVAITGGREVPSRLYRINALEPFFEKQSIEMMEICATINMYPPSKRLLRLPWIAAALTERLTYLYRTRGHNAVILQRELISTIPSFERMLPRPLIFDVDDAIYLYRNGKAARYIAYSCDLVVCGNNYLSDKFSKWNSNVVVIPTGVDTDKLRPNIISNTENKKIIGWIGTPSNYPFLELVEPAIRKVLHAFPKLKMQVISSEFPIFLKHFKNQLDFRLWYPGIENELLPNFTVGIMPLADNEWSRGKCAFKMLQYMAAGVPVVVSPVGINVEIFKQADIGFMASTIANWTEAIESLLNCPMTAKRMGCAGRYLVEKRYSLNQIASLWRQALEQHLGINGE